MGTCAHLCPQYHPTFPPILCSFNSCTLSALGLVLSYTIRCQAAPFSSLPVRSFPLGWGPPLCQPLSHLPQRVVPVPPHLQNVQQQEAPCITLSAVFVFLCRKKMNDSSGFIHRSSIPLFSTFNPESPSPHRLQPLIPIQSTSFLSHILPRWAVPSPFLTASLHVSSSWIYPRIPQTAAKQRAAAVDTCCLVEEQVPACVVIHINKYAKKKHTLPASCLHTIKVMQQTELILQAFKVKDWRPLGTHNLSQATLKWCMCMHTLM